MLRPSQRPRRNFEPGVSPPLLELSITSNMIAAHSTGGRMRMRATPELPARFGGDPGFEQHVKPDSGQDVDTDIQPIAMPFSEAPGPTAAEEAEDKPNERGLESGAGSQPIKCVAIQELFAKGASFHRI